MSTPRREFSARLLGSLIGFGLLEALWSRELLAAPVRPAIAAWFAELAAMTRDLRGHRLLDVEFQARMEELFARVDLAALTDLLDVDAALQRLELPGRGAATEAVDLTALTGLPGELGFSRRIFACRKGRSIVPHGHANMCTGFIVLRGTWRGRHYDRVETHADHHLIRPTIDRTFSPGDLSTISDHRDNVHWFEAESDTALIFNVHVSGYDPRIRAPPARLYLDPDGETLTGGLVRAAKMSRAACLHKYG